MEQISKIAPAFIAAKKAFGPALKAKNNPAFKGSKYADLAACLEAVDDALLEHGIALYQETSLDDTGVTIETCFLHESGELIRGGKLHVPASKQDPQGYGSALSYARRYSLMAACGIAAEDDDGNAACRPSAPRLSKPAPVDIEPWIAKMLAATSSKELNKVAQEAWDATQDERITTEHSRILAERKAAAKQLAEQA
jgi:hypothetical protein